MIASNEHSTAALMQQTHQNRQRKQEKQQGVIANQHYLRLPVNNVTTDQT